LLYIIDNLIRNHEAATEGYIGRHLRNMEHMKFKARSTAKRVAKFPQTIGHSILAAPNRMFNKQQKDQEREQRDELHSTVCSNIIEDQNDHITRKEEFHSHVCSNIIEDQHGRIAVRESQEQCMREITEHLKLHIFTMTDSDPQSVPRYEYKDWIEALHPDNVNYLRSGRSIIDHRFYIKDSHHRILWNEYMIKLDCRDAIVMEESRDPNLDKSLVDTLVEETNKCCGTMSNSCGLFP